MSLVPKLLIAHSFTGVGVRSMMLELTASTGDESGSSRDATRCPAAMPNRVAMTPKAAYWRRARMRVVRSGTARRLVHGGSGWVRMGQDAAMTELVHLETDGPRATITLDSPHNRNALSRQLVSELFERLRAAEADDDVRVVLVRSSGRVFCSGADLTEAREGGMEEGARVLVDLQRRGRGDVEAGGVPRSTGRCGPAASGSSPPATSCSRPRTPPSRSPR